MRLIDINPAEILELLKAAYYAQTGEEIQIGSSAFAASAAQAYAWGVLLANINDAAKNLFVDTANGEYLDLIAKNYGIETRPEYYHATAQFLITFYDSNREYPARSFVVSDNAGHAFTNLYPVKSPVSSIPIRGLATLYATDAGSDFNGIPAGDISTIESGGIYISSAVNVTETSGGTDGFPYTDDGNDAYRVWLETQIKTFAGAGTYEAYEARARNSDARIVSVYVLRQGDSGYVKGKVQIYIYADSSVIDQCVEIAQNACDDPAFRPIGDLVVVDASPLQNYTSALDLDIEYNSRFEHVASSRTSRVILAYCAEIETQIGRPFCVDELCHRLCAVDDDGVYANDAYARNTSGYILTKYPDPGKRLHVTQIGRYITYRD